MKYTRCEYGHYYDPSKYNSCPHCSVRLRQDEFTVAKSPVDERVAEIFDLQQESEPVIEAPVRRTQEAQGKAAREIPDAQEDSVTVARVAAITGIDPVVGWFVQTTGENRGKTYEIHSERNTIGRSSGMDICLKGDIGISRDTNGVISYNPRNRSFHLIPGEGKAIIYVNGEELLSPVQLCAYDRIEISETTLLFLPLCGEKFSWEEEHA